MSAQRASPWPVGARAASAGATHLLAVGCSALALHAFARVEAPWHALGFVLLVPWLAVLEPCRTPRAALASGLVMSVGFTLGVFSWFADAMAGYAEAPRWIGWLLLLVIAPLLQPQLVVFAVVRQRLRSAAHTPQGAAAAVLVAALAYVGAEWALPKLFGDTIGHGLLPSPRLRQAADLAGVPVLTLALLLVNEAVLGALRALRPSAERTRVRRLLPPLAAALGVVVLLAGYGTWRLARLAETTPRPRLLRAALVQAGLAGYERLRRERGSYEAVRLILDRHLSLSTQALADTPIDVVVWPETVYPTTFGSPRSEAGAEFDARIAGFAATRGVPLVFGAYDVDADGSGEYNAAFFLGSDGRYDVYRKAALFPLTERVPAWLDAAWLRRALPWLGTWQPGRGPNLATLPLDGGRREVRVLPLVCYDAVDPALARRAARAGARFILTLSNDSWFASGNGPRLHLAVSAFRSIETRLPQIRVTNTGISAVIDPSGELLQVLPVEARGVLVADVHEGPGGTTPVMRLGDALGPGALVLASTGLLGVRRERRPARSGS